MMNRTKMIKGWVRALRKWNVKNPASTLDYRPEMTFEQVIQMEETRKSFSERKAAHADHRTTNFVGKEFGKLLVWAATVVTATASPVWLCLCGCGQHEEIAAHRLLKNPPTDCGCLLRERRRIARHRRQVG